MALAFPKLVTVVKFSYFGTSPVYSFGHAQDLVVLVPHGLRDTLPLQHVGRLTNAVLIICSRLAVRRRPWQPRSGPLKGARESVLYGQYI